MKKNDLVRCLDTQRVGVVVDIKHASFCTMILVKWHESTKWVDAVDLECIDASF